MFSSFANLGIQCVRRKELDASLQKRRNKNIDPFNSELLLLNGYNLNLSEQSL